MLRVRAYYVRYTSGVDDVYQWPDEWPADVRDGLTFKDVVEALDAPVTLRMDNRTPSGGPTFLAVCAPTGEQRLIVVVCTRAAVDECGRS